MWIQTASSNLRRLSCAIATLTLLGTSACGSSSDEKSGDEKAIEEPKVLTANTAGKACVEETDCGTGTCKKQLQSAGGGLFGGGTMVVAPGGYCSFSCNLDADCGAGGVCVGANSTAGFGFGNAGGNTQPTTGLCLARCDASSQCREGYRCIDGNGRAMESGNAEAAANAIGSCQVAAETDQLSEGVVGSACAENADCGAGSCMTTSQITTFPDGYCTGRCLANADCGAGAECSQGFGGPGTCYKTCQEDAECGRAGYRCRSNALAPGGAKRCLPGAEPLPDGVVGSTCAADADCGGAAMSCILMSGEQALPGGYCSGGCVESVDCGGGAVCVGGIGGGVATGFCYKSCEAVSDCREGYACESLDFLGLGMMAAGDAGVPQNKVCMLPMAAANDADAGM